MAIALAMTFFAFVACDNGNSNGTGAGNGTNNETGNGSEVTIPQLQTPVIFSTTQAVIRIGICGNADLFRIELRQPNRLDEEPFFTAEAQGEQEGALARRIDIRDFDELADLYEEGIFNSGDIVRVDVIAIGDGVRFRNSESVGSAIGLPSLARETS
ncbi:MAG: hypothetical protein FWC80_05060 [Firmicutes bacterium]|nr:hypothetical protein [Bacillota bacterium]